MHPAGKKKMNNRDLKYAIEYHEETKHSEIKLQMFRHYLDWDNKPKPFKVYPELPSILLPRDFQVPASDALACISSTHPFLPESPLDIRALAQLLFFSAGITREMKFDSGTYYMRAASATGALYPIELYVVCRDIGGLQAGVYHFSPGDFSLAQLRRGDFRPQLAEMAGGNPGILSSPVTLAFTSIAWRNAWKYGDRSYRHWFWDSGVIAANLLAVAASAGLQPALAMGFADSAVNNLLCVEQRKEAAVVLASINLPSRTNSEMRPDPTPVAVATSPKILPISQIEVEHPEIWKIHKASSLATSEEVVQWLGAKINPNQKPGASRQERARDIPQGTAGLGDVILRRGSSRRFSHSAISQAQLSAILYSSTRGIPLDFLEEKASSVDVYFMANAVEGLTPGRYFYNRQSGSFESLASKSKIASRNESGYLCLGQPLFSDASAVFFVMADLDAHLKALGNRGYRACQFEAGVVAGKIYLSAYAQGLGASGSTFYDDAVTESFSPHAKDKSAMIAVGVGMPAYKARPGKVLAATLTRAELLNQ
ncbi:SagB/ThcOx family dehydrogenase [Nitrososphaera sp.]|uniref:SagB/ThcOx family dehydrogenase n=1 Tax=Nitrososphaera sp. TaxID=1971748 RepID=UPI003D6DA8E2